MTTELREFRRSVNRMLATGSVELPVVDAHGSHVVVFALADDPLFTLLAQLRNVGGYANVFVKDGDKVRRMSVVDSGSAIAMPDTDMSDEAPSPLAPVGVFLDYVNLHPNGVVLPVVNPINPGLARELAPA